jgi:hypothetical protein
MVPKVWHITNRKHLLELNEKWVMTCTFGWLQQNLSDLTQENIM